MQEQLTKKDALSILETTSDFQLGAEKVERFVGCPYVDGDNVALHTARSVRIAVYVMPFILKEFSNHPDVGSLAENIYATTLIHDDEEIVQGFDIISPLKNHNADIQEQIDLVKDKMKNLPVASSTYAIKLFSSFRKRDTLYSKISKVIENLASNQLVIEQKLGLITPDSVKFAIDFVDKFRGVSKTTDLLIDAQITQIINYRNFAKNNENEIDLLIDKSLTQEGCKLSKDYLRILIKKLLDIDVLSHQLDINKIQFNIWQYQ
jgi:hypothetical protein